MIFSVTTHRRADTLCLAVAGEIDLCTTARLEQALTDAFATGPSIVTVDLSATTFCDCTGITTLLTAYHRAQACGVHYHVTNPQHIVRRVLEALDLHDLLTGNRPASRGLASEGRGEDERDGQR